MKRLLSLLALPFLTAGLVACSSGDGDDASPTFQPVESSANDSAANTNDNDEGKDKNDSESRKDKEDSAKGDKDSGSSKLKERDAEDFRATGFRYETFASWGVQSPDGKVHCSFNETSEGPWCSVKLENPPIVPKPDNPQWEANMVSFKDGAGFFPFGVVDPGDLIPPQTLGEGEKVEINGVTFEAPSGNEFTVTVDGHHFTVKDGEFSADTYPIEPDSNGYAPVGAVCGEAVDKRGRQKIYVQTDGTNCSKAMEVVDKYVNHEWTMEEMNTRGILQIDGWECAFGEPEFFTMPDPNARLPKCQDLSGDSRVIFLDAENPEAPKPKSN